MHTATPDRGAEFVRLVEQIKDGSIEAEAELYRTFRNGIAYFLMRKLNVQDVDDALQEVFLATIEAIRSGRLEQPERLLGYIRSIAHHVVSQGVARYARSRKCDIPAEDLLHPLPSATPLPDEVVLSAERKRFVTKILAELKPREREVLTRFYLLDQRPEQIQREMGLTETQFRLIKSRAKEKFGARGTHRLTNGFENVATRLKSKYMHWQACA